LNLLEHKIKKNIAQPLNIGGENYKSIPNVTLERTYIR